MVEIANDLAAARDEQNQPSQPIFSADMPWSKETPLEPIYVESSVFTKRFSTGYVTTLNNTDSNLLLLDSLHPVLPVDVCSELHNFEEDDFASKYFATKRSGMLRQKVPLERIMEYQRTSITSPILVLSKGLTKDALASFKIIQHVMGDRDRAVDHARPMSSSSSGKDLSSLSRNGNGIGARNGDGMTMNDKSVILEEIKWMVQLGVSAGEMRDEIYCQLVKQLSKNPDRYVGVFPISAQEIFEAC